MCADPTCGLVVTSHGSEGYSHSLYVTAGQVRKHPDLFPDGKRLMIVPPSGAIPPGGLPVNVR